MEGGQINSPANPGKRGCLQIRGFKHNWGERTLVMGIVNVTPDSFSGDGLTSPEQAVEHARQLSLLGADVIDIGGMSTRPGHSPVDSSVEWQRVMPVIQQLRSQSEAVISIDTYTAPVLRQAIACGADILNSVRGLTGELLEVIRELPMPVVVMHNQDNPVYEHDVMDEVLAYLERHACRALAAGLRAEQIILDPGIGFGKLFEHNLSILRSLNRIVSLGFPTLLGISRKSFIGKITGRAVACRESGTAAAVALAVAAGIDIVRVHDVKAMVDVVKVSDSVVRHG